MGEASTVLDGVESGSTRRLGEAAADGLEERFPARPPFEKGLRLLRERLGAPDGVFALGKKMRHEVSGFANGTDPFHVNPHRTLV